MSNPPPPPRKYYSVRTGKDLSRARLDLPSLQRLVVAQYQEFVSRGYFQEAEGYDCVDSGHVQGKMGTDPAGYVFLRLRKPGIWPPGVSVEYDEEDLFDLVEFLFDHVSKPVPQRGDYHGYSNCGFHYSSFDSSTGREEFRESLNSLLGDYGDGWVLSAQGEILRRGPDSLAPLLDEPVRTTDQSNIGSRVEAARLKFRRHGSSVDDQRDAVRSLADVMEFLRDEAKKHLTKKDEQDLFHLANSFGIRHHNQTQKVDYDPQIWLPWMFYYYLATIHALLAILGRENVPLPTIPPEL